MRRVPEVIDVWFDSGSMPFAQYHAPFENAEHFEERFPADFICEALDQTRGWFYSLLAISTLLFDQSSYRNVVCLGLILDEQGRKMSKSLGNMVEPVGGHRPLRRRRAALVLLHLQAPWDGYRFSLETIGEAVRQFLLQLWNTYGFYVLYANANGVARAPAARRPSSTELDRWALSRLQATVATVRDRLDDFDATGAGRAIQEFVDELSNWYVRRSRRRFWDGDPAAFATLRTCLVTVAKLLAPVHARSSPTRSTTTSTAPSRACTCATFPTPAERDLELEEAMAVARETVRLGLAARGQAKLKVRQPLRAAVVVAAGREREAIERLDRDRARGAQRAGAALRRRGRRAGEVEIKPNYRTLGPAVRQADAAGGAAVAGARPGPRGAALRDGRPVAISVGGQDHELTADDLLVSMKPLEGYQVEREGSHAVALELELDDELRAEGWAREIVHAVQAARRTPAWTSRTGSCSRWTATTDCWRRGARPRGLHRRRDAARRG